jgi:hypothetical protein
MDHTAEGAKVASVESLSLLQRVMVLGSYTDYLHRDRLALWLWRDHCTAGAYALEADWLSAMKGTEQASAPHESRVAMFPSDYQKPLW